MSVLNVEKELRVQAVREDMDTITVVTAGAQYVFVKSGERGKILCRQRINRERLLATIELPFPLSGITVEKQDASTCMLQQLFGRGCYWLKLQVNGDSLLEIATSQREANLNLSFTGDFVPEFDEEKDGNCLLADPIGGIGLYPQRGHHGRVSRARSGRKDWQVDYRLNATHPRLFVSVFPPRPFDEKHYRDLRGSGIAMYGYSSTIGAQGEFIDLPYPTDDELERAAKHASVFVLFLQFNGGRLTRKDPARRAERATHPDASYSAPEFAPLDEKEQARVIRKAHALQMKVLPYLAPYHCVAQGRDFLRLVADMLGRYDFDGVYFDGLAPDVLAAYDMIRDLRKLLKDKVLFLHTSLDPFDSDTVYCPFIHTYADYVLRSEFERTPDDRFLRYSISGYNTSNTINYACTPIFTPDAIRALMDKALEYKVRFVFGLPEGDPERTVREEYWPKLRAREEG